MLPRTMHRRLPISTASLPTLVAATLATTLGVGMLGCDETQTNQDPLADIASRYHTLVQNRQINRESPDQIDDTATELRTLAGRAESAGRGGDGMGAAVLASGIRSSAATFEAQEALRIESKTNRLRSIARQLIVDADLLGGSAENAENFDLSDVDLYLESEMSDAADRVAKAQEELDQLNRNRAEVVSQQQARLDRAREQEAAAVEIAREGVDRGPLDGLDSINESIQYRQVANRERIAAARDEISVQTLVPTIALVNSEVDGQSSVVDSARQAREDARSRRDEARSFAKEVRDELGGMATMVNELLAEVTQLEDTQVLPRLDAAIGDYQAAIAAARPLTRGTKQEKTTGWRTIANAQLGLGYAEWEKVTVLGRRADLLDRLANSDILEDQDGTLETSIDSAVSGAETAADAAKAALNEALSALGNITAQDATTARTKQAIQLALQGLDGQSMRPEEPKTRTRSSRRGRGSRDAGGRSSRSGPGFASPAEAAAFLNDPSNSFAPRTLKRLEDSMRARGRDAKNLRGIFTLGSFMAPLFEALERKFGDQAAMSAMSSDLDLGAMGQMRFEVADESGDQAVIEADGGGMQTAIVLTKDDGRWFLDLDGTIDQNPELAAAAQLMGPMLATQMKPMKNAASRIAKNVRAGDYDTAAEAMAAFEAEVAKAAEASSEGNRGGGLGGLLGG